ncbi:MAG: DUF222 domain-containing protein [Trebonia sp.]|uniref:HNH endonuclease signature motif containing protein n=4 Tax=Trebonia sp. TaxID=2767075 RepID=UPI003C77DE44
MSEASFPGPGPDGEQPPPGIPARDETAGMPAGVPAEDDWDGDAEMAAYIADLDAGRARIPEEWEIEGPAATISLGDAADVDLTELAAMLGPDGLGGEVFARDRSAGAMRPGPVLSALTEQAAGDLGRLTDNQVIGAMSAARRLAARAAYLELTAVAEFTRRREAQLADATARRVPRGCRDGEFPDAELAYELVTSSNAARDQMDLATDLETRLPRTWAALGAGRIDEGRARLIWRPTRCLSDADAADADELLAGLAPGLRYDQLARKATAVAMKLDPEAFKRGKDKERRDRQRVVAGREESGNAYLSARELAIEDALASKAHIDALAVMLRRGGLPGTLQHLRVLAFNDLTQGRSPLDRLTSPPPTGQGGLEPSGGASQARSVPCGDTGAGEGGHDSTDAGDSGDASWDGYPDMPEWQHERHGTTEDDDHPDDAPATPAGPPAPFPALINLTVPAGNIFGWSSAPGEAGSWGLTDPDDTRRLVQAASAHPRTRWCFTLLGPDGTAVAHGCARGQHPWTPGPDSGGGSRDGPATSGTTATGHSGRDGPDARQAAALADLLRDLNVTFTPIAKGTCDHAGQEDRYTPSRKLKHLVRARTATCPAPGCGAQAYHNDLDHTLAYPAGITCQCDLAPPCRRHHRVKQAPGWTLTQPEPGVMRWTTPSGRSYTTRPTVYDA